MMNVVPLQVRPPVAKGGRVWMPNLLNPSLLMDPWVVPSFLVIAHEALKVSCPTHPSGQEEPQDQA